MTFIDPYKQNDSYTIEIKKNAYFDYEKNMEESSKAFQNRTSYNLKVPKRELRLWWKMLNLGICQKQIQIKRFTRFII